MSSAVHPFRLDRILCPTDFSDFSASALSYASALSASYGSALRLLHVLTPFPVVAPYVSLPGDGQLYESQRAQGEQALAAEARRVRRPGVVVDTELREGSAVREILDAADAWRAELIMLGTHGRGGFERLVLGSVAEKILRQAACPVMTVPYDAVGRAAGAIRFSHVLCPHDGSAASSRGVAYAASLAERTGPAFGAFHAAREQHAQAALDSALPADVRGRCQVTDRVVYGHPAQQILDVAAQEAPDLIVMGVQGRGALDLAMFGSTTNHVVRHAAQPVLTVRPAPAGA